MGACGARRARDRERKSSVAKERSRRKLLVVAKDDDNNKHSSDEGHTSSRDVGDDGRNPAHLSPRLRLYWKP